MNGRNEGRYKYTLLEIKGIYLIYIKDVFT